MQVTVEYYNSWVEKGISSFKLFRNCVVKSINGVMIELLDCHGNKIVLNNGFGKVELYNPNKNKKKCIILK